MQKKTILIVAALGLLSGCAQRPHIKALPLTIPNDALKTVPDRQIPDLADDMDDISLETALEKSLSYYRDLPGNAQIFFGRDAYKISTLRRSFEQFSELIRTIKDPEERKKAIQKHFTLYKSTGSSPQGNVIFSAYYEPVLAARLTPNAEYRYPLYGKPQDLVEIDLGDLNVLWKGRKAVARVEGNFLNPYYTRTDIDSRQVLQGRGLEIAWARDPYDVYLLQVEGSGWLKIDGSTETIRIRYAASNGQPYRSVGLSVIERGLMSSRDVSVKGLRSYFQDHPEKRQEILNTNPRYIFFWLDRSPDSAWAFGNLNVPLTPGRSVATDPALFPAGALGWIKTQMPVLDKEGKVIGSKPLSRFVLNQDEGGAIKGPARLDLFVGSVDDAGRFAGKFWQAGELYFLVIKN